VSVVFCQVEISASDRSLVQRSSTDCGVFECDREAKIMKGPGTLVGCCATGQKAPIGCDTVEIGTSVGLLGGNCCVFKG
jgi:hypothetical protein